jgi:hypothetical protein
VLKLSTTEPYYHCHSGPTRRAPCSQAGWTEPGSSNESPHPNQTLAAPLYGSRNHGAATGAGGWRRGTPPPHAGRLPVPYHASLVCKPWRRLLSTAAATTLNLAFCYMVQLKSRQVTRLAPVLGESSSLLGLLHSRYIVGTLVCLWPCCLFLKCYCKCLDCE